MGFTGNKLFESGGGFVVSQKSNDRIKRRPENQAGKNTENIFLIQLFDFLFPTEEQRTAYHNKNRNSPSGTGVSDIKNMPAQRMNACGTQILRRNMQKNDGKG